MTAGAPITMARRSLCHCGGTPLAPRGSCNYTVFGLQCSAGPCYTRARGLPPMERGTDAEG